MIIDASMFENGNAYISPSYVSNGRWMVRRDAVVLGVGLVDWADANDEIADRLQSTVTRKTDCEMETLWPKSPSVEFLPTCWQMNGRASMSLYMEKEGAGVLFLDRRIVIALDIDPESSWMSDRLTWDDDEPEYWARMISMQPVVCDGVLLHVMVPLVHELPKFDIVMGERR